MKRSKDLSPLYSNACLPFPIASTWKFNSNKSNLEGGFNP